MHFLLCLFIFWKNDMRNVNKPLLNDTMFMEFSSHSFHITQDKDHQTEMLVVLLLFIGTAVQLLFQRLR